MTTTDATAIPVDESGQSAGFGTIRGPLTLDDVSQHMNAICEDHLATISTAQRNLESRLESLGEACEATPGIDKNAVGSIVMGRVNQLMRDAAKVLG